MSVTHLFLGIAKLNIVSHFILKVYVSLYEFKC